MNIFALHNCPIESAKIQHDKHVVKMILESAQMLCSVFDNEKYNDIPYKRTHYNHPCTVWTRTDLNNFYWLVNHALALCNEYTHRFNKTHKSQAVIDWCLENSDRLNIPQQKITNFAQAMPDEYKHESDHTQAYMGYYIATKIKNKPKWTNRNVPHVFKQHII